MNQPRRGDIKRNMANTYTQIYIHSVFAVKGQESLILRNWKDELYKYITGIVQANGHKLISIGGMPDHIHVFCGMKPVQAVSNLMKDIKGSSSKWINEKQFVSARFEWQSGFGAFSYAHSQVDAVVKYILDQEQHHRKKSFKQEYQELLTKFNIDYNQKYVLNEVEGLYRP